MLTSKYALTILLCLIYSTNCIPRIDPLVETNVGFIRGMTASDGDYAMFLGIPYATVNASNPFGASIPVESFEGTFNAYDDSAVCPHREEYNKTIVGTLDCLHLNIFVPFTATSRNRLPVLVWIHGGGFRFGSGNRFEQGPKFLVRHDVIVVTITYRLGPYGFLCLNTPEVPGNQGIKDQLTALRWIKNNIESFGGDSSRITINGESAGGASVDLHLLYAKENLFNNVIIQSGTSLSSFASTKPDPSAPLRLAAHLGHSTSSLDDALEFLRTVNTDLVVAAKYELNIATAPCIEQEFENVDGFITSHPSEVTISDANTKSVMIGFNDNESGDNFMNLDSTDPFGILSNHFDYDTELLAELKENVRKFYIGDEDLNGDVSKQIAGFRSDLIFYYPSYNTIRKYLQNGVSSIYHYMFSYSGNRNYVKNRTNSTTNGAVHADELSYLFDMVLFPETPTPEDQLIIDRMTTLWTNFAKYSNPTPEVTDILPVQLPALTETTMDCLNIDSELTVIKRPFHERMAFWDLFYKLDEVINKTD